MGTVRFALPTILTSCDKPEDPTRDKRQASFCIIDPLNWDVPKRGASLNTKAPCAVVDVDNYYHGGMLFERTTLVTPLRLHALTT